jgi:motility quorum-sensing regulator/GCU-specific mRNA interferase toxin
MEKRKPHYPLKDIQEKVRSEGADVFTRTAIEKSKEMGLTIQQAIDVVCSMTSECFYKTMTTHNSSKIWQDVYHSQTPIEKTAYIKVTLREEGSIVIQFKDKNDEND